MRLKKDPRPLSALLAASFVCAALTAPGVVAQDKKKDGAPPPPLSVKLGALVLDSRGNPVVGLGRDDFQILEDGVPQKISVFEWQEGPQVFGLLVDSSGSLRDKIDKVIAFAQTIAAHTDAGSEGFVISFISSDEIKMMQDIT